MQKHEAWNKNRYKDDQEVYLEPSLTSMMKVFCI